MKKRLVYQSNPGSVERVKKKRSASYANIDWAKAQAIFSKPPAAPAPKSGYPSAKTVLHVLAAVGAIGLVIAFPQAGKHLAPLLLGGAAYSPWKTRKTLAQLKKQKYVTVDYGEKGDVTVRITRRGQTKALTYLLEELHIARPAQWDKKWRTIIFDIPEMKRVARNRFQRKLSQIGMYQLQKSVYVSPYPCFNEIEFLRELFEIPVRAKYLLAEKIEDDELLRGHFGLLE